MSPSRVPSYIAPLKTRNCNSVWLCECSDKLVMAHIIWLFFFLNDTAISWVLSSHLWILYHHVSPLQCRFQTFAGVAMKCTLHWHSILTTPLPLRSGNAVLICIFATHSNATPVSHSNATPKVHFNVTPECTLHCHSITTTPMPLSQNTPMPPGVSLEC